MKRIGSVLMALALLTGAVQAAASEFKWIPSVQAEVEYNDNVLFTPENRGRDLIGVLAPRLALAYHTERTDLEMVGGLKYFKYHEYPEFDGTDYDAEAHGRHRWTQRLTTSAQAAYVRDSRPDRDITETGVVFSMTPRQSVRAGLGTEYLVSELLVVRGNYLYHQNEYDEDRFPGDQTHEVSAGLGYRMDRFVNRTTARVGVSYRNTTFPDSGLDSVGGTVGVSWKLNELWTLDGDIGARLTRLDPTGGFETQESWNAVGSLSAYYHGEYLKGSLMYSRDIAPASGSGGATQRDTVGLSVNYRLTYEISANLNAYYVHSRSEAMQFAVRSIDQSSWRAMPSLRYEISNRMLIEAGYEYTRVENAETSRRVNRYMLNLKYTF